MDPHHLDADEDLDLIPAFHPDADPDPILKFDSDPDPDPTTHVSPDLDPTVVQNDPLTFSLSCSGSGSCYSL